MSEMSKPTNEIIREAANHIFVYVIHDLTNHCDGGPPSAVIASDLKEAYLKAYHADHSVKILLSRYNDTKHLCGLDSHFNPIPNFRVNEEDVHKALCECDEMVIVRCSESLINYY